MAPESSGVFIIHLLDPVAIIRVSDGHWPGDISKQLTYINPDGIREDYTLSIYHMFSPDFLEVPEDRAFKLLSKAWHWYKSYLTWEDKNIENDN